LKKLIISLLLSFGFLFGEEGKNLLLITIDTIRPDRISFYSSKYLKTPNIDSVAKSGVVFMRAFAHNPTTLPSHTNILLGTTPLYHGVHDNSHFKVDERFTTLAEFLKKYGFSTGAFIGSFPLDSRFGLSQGFDLYDDSYPSKGKEELTFPERKAEKVIESAINWIKKQKEPWFAWIHLFDPHQPYIPPEPFFSQFKNDLYSGEVAYVDKFLGRLLNFLKEENREKRTFIIITGDHGESLGEHGESTHGYFAYNSTLLVPLIISGPGITHSLSYEYVCHIDIFPTVCDLLKKEKPDFLQGLSLYPILKGKGIRKREIYFESLHAYYNRGWAPLKGIIIEKKKYISLPIPELYDMEKDFDERENLISSVDREYYEENLSALEAKLKGNEKKEGLRKIDRETLEKLESLGYISSPYPSLKRKFGPEDDLKTLLPIQQKFSDSMLLYQKGKLEDAIRLLKEIIEERKDFDLAYCRLSQIYKGKGRIADALETMREGYRNNPDNHFVISTYGILLSEIGNPDEGIKVLERGISFYGFDPELWNYLGIAYWRKGYFEKAKEAYRKALSLDENYALVYNNLGSLYLSLYLKTKKREDINQAIQNFKKGIELDPELSSAYNGLGGAYKSIGDIDSAISCWEKAVALNPNFEFPIYNLGITYFERGEKEKALGYLQRYLNLKRGNISLEEKRMIETIIQKCKE
jgi:arylsulfatase A-like enzyme/Flp pilus assembly protein TadD